MAAGLAALLERQIATATGLAEGGGTAAEVAGAVADFCGAQRIEGPVPDAYLATLVHRALCGVGEEGAAAAWAEARLPGSGLPEQFRPSAWPGPVPLGVWRLFASGLVRFGRGKWADGRELCRLDFGRLGGEGAAGWMALTLFPGLRGLLRELAPGWDAAGGRGVLGLRGLFARGFAPAPRKGEIAAGEVRRHCAAELGALARERGWGAVPEVVYLDLPPRRRRRKI